jgi:hypothetical protein
MLQARHAGLQDGDAKTPPDHEVDLGPRWRDRSEIEAAFASRQEAARRAGLTHTLERLSSALARAADPLVAGVVNPPGLGGEVGRHRTLGGFYPVLPGEKVISGGSIRDDPKTPEGSIMNSPLTRLVGMVLAPVFLGLGLTACTQGASPPHQTQGFTTRTPARESAPPSSAPTSSPVASPATSSSAVTSTPRATILTMADGRYAARITAVDSHRRLVTVDVVQFFFGEAAATAAAQDHSSEVPPPNDYWIRNQSHLLRTLSVTSTAPITVNGLGAPITHSADKDLHVTLARLGRFPDLNDGIFWLTVRHGVVTRIAEQYRP